MKWKWISWKYYYKGKYIYEEYIIKYLLLNFAIYLAFTLYNWLLDFKRLKLKIKFLFLIDY